MKKTWLIALLCICNLSACSTLHQMNDLNKQQLNDPYEPFNRKVYAFNQTADKYVLKPVAKTYSKILPKPAKKGVSNFFSNLREPLNVLNNSLQGKFDRALTSSYRFFVNSTLGIFGLFDVAKAYDVEPAKEDFGQTLGAWGVKPGPYLMLPFFGPSNLRDGIGLIPDKLFDPLYQISDSNSTQIGLFIVKSTNTRYKLLSLDSVLESQINPYTFVKNAYQQNRINVLYDGNPPETESNDFNDF